MPRKRADSGKKPAHNQALIRSDDPNTTDIYHNSLPNTRSSRLRSNNRSKPAVILKGQQDTVAAVEAFVPRRSKRIAEKQQPVQPVAAPLLKRKASIPQPERPAKSQSQRQPPTTFKPPQKARATPKNPLKERPLTRTLPKETKRQQASTRASAKRLQQQVDPKDDKREARQGQQTRTSTERTKDTDKNSGLSPWLESIEPGEPPEEPPEIPKDADVTHIMPVGERDSAVDTEESESQVLGDVLTDKALKPKGPKSTGKSTTKGGRDTDSLFHAKLTQRYADPDSETTGDPHGDSIAAKVDPRPILGLSAEDMKEVYQIINAFKEVCDKASSDPNRFKAFEDFRQSMNEWLPNHRLSTVTSKDFGKDLALCRRNWANEAIFQRTVLLTAIDRWRLSSEFDYTCESLWSQDISHSLPSLPGSRTLSRPQPDMNLSFSIHTIRNGLNGYSFAPEDLYGCVFPDSNIKRCFPFFFVEAKKSDMQLSRSRLSNTNNTAHALQNIYLCMKRAKMTQVFFQHVRVFSICINAERVEARIHKGVLEPPEQNLRFVWQSIAILNDYSRDSMHNLVQIILNGYVKEILLPVLRKVFRALVKIRLEDLPAEDESPQQIFGAWERAKNLQEQHNRVQEDQNRTRNETEHMNGTGRAVQDEHLVDADSLEPSTRKGRKRKATEQNSKGRSSKISNPQPGPDISFGGSGPMAGMHISEQGNG